MNGQSLLPIIISLCAAVAAGGMFYIQKVRLSLERAVVKVISFRETAYGSLSITVENVGNRPAIDVELAISSLRPAQYVEGIKAGGEYVFALAEFGLPAVVTLSYGDPYGRRLAETRKLTRTGEKLLLSRPEKACPTIVSAVGTEEARLKAPTSAPALPGS